MFKSRVRKSRQKNKMKAEDEYCPKCGAELVFVCKKCFKEIQDIDEDHRICNHCIEEAQEKKEKRIEKVKDYGKKAAVAAGTGVLAVGGKIVTKVMKDEEKEIVKEILVNCMENVAKLSVPLKVDVAEGGNWYDAK